MADKTTLSPLFSFVLCAFFAWAVRYLPLVERYFDWHDTFFHELSHGLAALVTGGTIVKLSLNWDGSGSLHHFGSKVPSIVSYAGYAGATLLGWLIFVVTSSSYRLSRRWALALAILILISAALWVRGFESLSICLVLVLGFIALWYFGSFLITQLVLQTVGLFLVIKGVEQAWWLMFHSRSHKNDAHTLETLSGLPSVFWALTWLIISIVVLFALARRIFRI